TTYGEDATVVVGTTAFPLTGTAIVLGQAAILNGTVIPPPTGIYPTTAYFEYGLTTGYGTSVPVSLPFPYGSSTQNLSVQIGGMPPLQPGSLYHFRLVAVHATGTIYGNDATFTTDYVEPTASYGPVVVQSASSVIL